MEGVVVLTLTVFGSVVIAVVAAAVADLGKGSVGGGSVFGLEADPSADGIWLLGGGSRPDIALMCG